MSNQVFASYVAIGDSLSEGLGDFDFHSDRHHKGWTDRLAAMLSAHAENLGHEFHYANLALRGSKLKTILTKQLQQALELKPDLVTIMAGSNDLVTGNLEELEATFRNGLRQLQAAGCRVVVVTTIRPSHLNLFKVVLPMAEAISSMLVRLAQEASVDVLDVHSIESFSDIRYWAEDMVHFSGHGHIVIANKAAALMGIPQRMPEANATDMHKPSRGLVGTARWFVLYAIPFIQRRIKGTTSGDNMLPKHQNLVPYSNQAFEIIHEPRSAFARAA